MLNDPHFIIITKYIITREDMTSAAPGVCHHVAFFFLLSLVAVGLVDDF